MNITKKIAGAALAGAMTLAVAGTAQAAPPIVVSGGLVNVVVTDVIDDITVTVQDINVGVGVAAAIAANVCDLNVAAVLADIRDDGAASCEADASDLAVDISQL